MADAAVTQAIYALGLDPSAYTQASQKVVQANEQIVSSTEKVTVAEESVTKATTTRASSLDRIRARYDDAFRAQQNYEREVQAVNKAEAAGVGSIQQRAAALRAANQNYEAAILRLNSGLKTTAGAIGLNRIGMMELQASGINAFQALAAGMDPFRVATMEGAQVMGAFVQGGLLAGRTILGLAGPIGSGVALVGTLVAAFMNLGGAEEDAAASAEQLAKVHDDVNKVLLTTKEQAEQTAQALHDKAVKETEDTIAALEKDVERLRGVQKQFAAGLVINPVTGMQEDTGAVAKIQAQIIATEADADELRDKLARLKDPSLDGKARETAEKTQEKADEALAAVDRQIDGLHRETAAVDEDKTKREVLAKVMEAENALRRGGVDLQGAEAKARLAQVETAAQELASRQQVIDARKKEKEGYAAVDEQIDRLKREADAVSVDATQRKVLAQVLQAENTLRQKGIDLQSEQAQKELESVRATAAEVAAKEEAVKKQEKAQKDFERTVKSATNHATNEASNILYDAFTGKITSVGDFLKKTLLRAAADAAAQMIFRPLIQPMMQSVVGAVPSLFGLSGGAAGASASGGPGLLSTGSSLFSLGNSTGIFGSGGLFGAGGFSGLIDNFGAHLGFGGVEAAAPSASFIGPMPATNGILGTTSFSQFLGGAGAGFAAGSLLNNLIGGNSTNGTIGAGLGAAGGAALAALAPETLGISVLLGGLIGGAGGGVLGGLFGPGKSVGPIGSANFNVVNGQLVRGPTAVDNGGDLGAITKAGDTLVQTLNALNTSLNLSLTGSGFISSVGFGQAPGPHTSEEVVRAIYGSGRISSGNSTLDNAIRSYFSGSATSGQNADQLTATLTDMVQMFNALNPTTVDAVSQGLKAINDQFDAMVQKAQGYGFATSAIDAKRQQAIDTYNIGLRQPYYQAAGGIVDFLNGQALNDNSSLSPTERLTLAQRQFGQLLDKVRGGDVSSSGALTQAASNLLTIGRQNFASSVSFANLESNVRSSLLGVAESFTNDTSVDRMIAATAQQTSVQQAGFDSIVKAVNDLKREVTLLRQQAAA